MSKGKSHVMASNDHLAKMDLFQLPLTKQSAFQKAGNNKALEVKKIKNKNPTNDYNQASKEEILTAGDLQPRCKQMTPPSIASCTPYDRKSKWCMLFITDAMTSSSWLKSLTKDTTSQVENIF